MIVMLVRKASKLMDPVGIPSKYTSPFVGIQRRRDNVKEL